MLDKMVEEKWVTAKAVIGFWPAARDGDDIIVFDDDTRNAELARLHTLRQQMLRTNNRPNFALADCVSSQSAASRIIKALLLHQAMEKTRLQNLKQMEMIIAPS